MHDPFAIEILHRASSLVACDLEARGLAQAALSDDELGALLADATDDLDALLAVDLDTLTPAARQIADRALAGERQMAVAA